MIVKRRLHLKNGFNSIRQMPPRDVIVGALARVGWYALDVPCAWCLRTDERAACAWKDDDEGMDEDYETSLLFSSAHVNASMREILDDGRAETVRHMNGKTFDAHLEEVAALLRAWGAPEACATAGLGHTVYGSEAFPVRLKRFVDRKSTRAAVGTWTERLMFAYATTSQRKWYRAMVSEEFDGGRGESTPTPKFVAINFYTGERREMSDLEGAMLTLMHAADVYSVLKRDVEVDEMRVAVGFVLRLIVVASEGVQRAARQTANVDVRNALTKLHRHLDETVVRDIMSSSVRVAPSYSKLSSVRDSGIEAATKTLRRARTDVGLVLRATGVV